MRCCRWLVLFSIFACATQPAPAPVRIDVLGDGDATLVRDVQVLAQPPGAERVRLAAGRLVVRLAAGTRLERMVVESEEGVDVLTLVVDDDDSAPPALCHVRLAHRDHQLAVVLQHTDEVSEVLLAVFPPG